MALTDKDLEAIKNLIDDSRNEIATTFNAFKEELKEDLDERFSKQRSDFFEKVDPVLKEFMASREEREIVSERISSHEDRITNIESHLHIATD